MVVVNLYLPKQLSFSIKKFPFSFSLTISNLFFLKKEFVTFYLCKAMCEK